MDKTVYYIKTLKETLTQSKSINTYANKHMRYSSIDNNTCGSELRIFPCVTGMWLGLANLILKFSKY